MQDLLSSNSPTTTPYTNGTITSRANLIEGTASNDALIATGTDSAIFDGGKGNDSIYIMQSGTQDTVRFNLGDGQDEINTYDWQGVQDTVQFGKDVTAEMVGFTRSGSDLVVTVGNNGDRMTFKSFFTDESFQTFTRFEFADGAVWNNIKETALWKNSDLRPVIRGTARNDTLLGGGIFDGGKGKDTIIAEQTGSQDTLRFNLGDGKDTIVSSDVKGVQDTVQFGKDVTTEMISFTRKGDNLVVNVGNQGDQMAFKGFFLGDSHQTFTRFEFIDGSVWQDVTQTSQWKSGIQTPANVSNAMANSTRSVSGESLANQASSLITAMATFSPQESGISLQPEHNALSTTPLLASSAV